VGTSLTRTDRITGPGLDYAILDIQNLGTHFSFEWHPEVPRHGAAFAVVFQSRMGELVLLWNRMNQRGVFPGRLEPAVNGCWLMCPREVAEQAEAIVHESIAAGLVAHHASLAVEDG